MNGLCKWFDRYRDDELDGGRRALFDLHLKQCDRCRSGIALLNNLRAVIQAGAVPLSDSFSRNTARIAVQQNETWDAMVVSWLRPARAWLAFATVLVSFILGALSPFRTPSADYGDYEVLVTLNDSSGMILQAYAEEMIYSSEHEGVNQ